MAVFVTRGIAAMVSSVASAALAVTGGLSSALPVAFVAVTYLMQHWRLQSFAAAALLSEGKEKFCFQEF